MCLSPPRVLEGAMVGKRQLFKHSGMSHCSPLDGLFLPYKAHKGIGNLVITAGGKKEKKKHLCSSWSDFSSWEKLSWGPNTRNRQASSHCLGNRKKHKAERDQTVLSKIDGEPAGENIQTLVNLPS